LFLGTAIHAALESGNVQDAINSYRSNYNVLTDEHINEEIKLEYLIPKVLDVLPPGECEVEIKTDNFVGYIDRLVYLLTDDQGVKHYDIYDYKYSNNVDNYLRSGQLSLYKYYYEKTHPNTIIDHLRYVFIPKVNIRQRFKAKIPETLFEFRLRLQEELAKTKVEMVDVEYDESSVEDFKQCCDFIEGCTIFPKNPTNLCTWCQYQAYCETDGAVDWMILK
jgi:hypothetical protein